MALSTRHIEPLLPSKSYSAAVIADGASCYLKLDETSGGTAEDSVGTADFAYTNTPTLGATGLITGSGTAVTLNGTDEYLAVYGPSEVNVGDKFSFECWLKRDGTGERFIWGWDWSGGHSIKFNSSDEIEFAKAGYGTIVKSTTTVTDTNTHHLVVTKDGSTVKIWLDASDVTGTVTNQTFGSVSGWTGVGHLAGQTYYKGTLDEIAWYKNVALTSGQVANHYALGTGGATVVSRSAAVGATAAIATDRRVITTTRRQTFGVCVHPGWTDKTYNDYANCFSDLDALNVRLLRGGATGDGNITQWLSRCYQRGTGMIYGPPDTITGLSSTWLDTLESQIESYTGVIVAIEGLNEPDLFGPYAEQDTGAGETNCEYALRHQTALYNAITGRFGSALPVLAPSISSDWTDALANDVDGYCDLANVHYYTASGTASPDLAAINTQMANARTYAGVTDTWVTETGIRSPVTGCTVEQGAARLVQILNRFTIDAATPALKVCVYQLESPDSTGWEENDWAIHYYGFSPKLDATAYGAYIDGRTGYFKATAAVAAAGQKVTATERAAVVSATAAIASAGIEVLERSAAVDATTAITASGTKIAVVSRSAALSAAALVESSANERLSRSAALDATASVGVVGRRDLPRSAALDGAAAILVAGTKQVPRSAVLAATAAVVASGEKSGVVARSATLTAATSVTAAHEREAQRQAQIAASAYVESSASERLARSAALAATATVAATGHAIIERSGALTATSAVTVVGVEAISRSAAIGATAAITTDFNRDLLRSAALAATTSVAAAGEVSGIVERGASVAATTQIASVPQREIIRSAAIVSAASVATASRRELQRSATLTAITQVTVVSGGAAVERSAAVGSATSIIASGGIIVGRSAALGAQADATVQAFGRDLARRVQVGATGTLSVAGEATVGRGAALDAISAVAVQSFTRDLLRGAGIDATTTIAASAVNAGLEVPAALTLATSATGVTLSSSAVTAGVTPDVILAELESGATEIGVMTDAVEIELTTTSH